MRPTVYHMLYIRVRNDPIFTQIQEMPTYFLTFRVINDQRHTLRIRMGPLGVPACLILVLTYPNFTTFAQREYHQHYLKFH